MKKSNPLPNRREVLTATLAGTALLTAESQDSRAREASDQPLLEKQADGTPHKGKVLLAVQAHSDDIPLTAAGTVANCPDWGGCRWLRGVSRLGYL